MLYLQNLVSKQLQRGLPWEFQPTEDVTDTIRHTLTARQAWYQNRNTKHSFYTLTEGASDQQRVTKDGGENPARLLHGVCADYDLKLTEAEILAGIEQMGTRKPTWWETSLGGKFRLVWVFEEPLRVLGTGFAVSALKYLHDWLPVDKLPGLDEPAFIEPVKLYANGCVWRNLGNPPISSEEVHGLFVKVAREYSHCGPEAGPEIPFPVVHTALLEKYPGLRWPSEFILNSQGPSFWVSGSTSPLSALVKETGLMTFAGHAERPFYSWRDLLGSEFVEKYELQTLSNATKETFYDGTQYWRKLPSGLWQGETPEEIRQFLKIDCKVSAKAANGEPSQLDRCLQHIRNYNRVSGAAPHVFRSPGLMTISGKSYLNTWRSTVIAPAAAGTWAEAPFLAAWLPRLFVTEEQLAWALSWLSYAYRNIIALSPVPGHALFLAGGVGTGKSLYSRYVVGGLLGGFQDAASFLLGEDSFNSELFEVGVWCIDDETMTGDERIRRKFAGMVKKVTANSEFRHNKKFADASRVEWVGRLIVTLNFDQTSNRTLVDPESGMMDKVALLRAADVHTTDFKFPSRSEVVKLLAAELPILGRILLDFNIPEQFQGDSRYGVKPFHAPSMLQQASQSAPSNSCFELISEWRTQFFGAEGAKAEFWDGTATMLYRSMLCDPSLAPLALKHTPDHLGRMILSLKAMGILRVDTHTATGNVRHFRIYRNDDIPAINVETTVEPAPAAPTQPIFNTPKSSNPFSKI